MDKDQIHIPKLFYRNQEADLHKWKLLTTCTETLDWLKTEDWWCLGPHLDASQPEDYARGDHVPCSSLLYTAFKISVSQWATWRWSWDISPPSPQVAGLLNIVTFPFTPTLVSWVLALSSEQLSLALVPASSSYRIFNMLALPVHNQVSSLHLLVFFWFLPSSFCNFQHTDPVHIFKCVPKYFPCSNCK